MLSEYLSSEEHSQLHHPVSPVDYGALACESIALSRQMTEGGFERADNRLGFNSPPLSESDSFEDLKQDDDAFETAHFLNKLDDVKSNHTQLLRQTSHTSAETT